MTQEQTQASEASALERRIDMTVALADIDQDVDRRLKKLSKTVKMAGFRPGKVPFKMVAQQYGYQARGEAIEAAVERAFGEKVREQKLRVAGYPRVEPQSGGTDGQLAFSAVFEVYPEITVADLSASEIEKAVLTVGDAEVDKTIEALRKQRLTFVEVDRPAQKDDRIVIDFTGRKDGVEFDGGKAEDFSLQVGAGRMVADFDAAMEGLKAGDTKTFDVKFPDDYHGKDLAGQTVQFDVVCKRVDAPQLPEVDTEFAKVLGIAEGDLVKMREEIRSNLEREVKKRLESRVKSQVMDALLAAHPVDVPKALVEAESQQMAQKALEDLKQRGLAVKDIPVDPTWFTEQATRRVRLGLVVAEVVKSKELHAKAEQVKAVVDDFAQTFEDPSEVVRWYYSQPQRLAEAEALAIEGNVVAWALAQAKVTEKPVDFDELMGDGA
ncbi:trigger factor [Denitratisoma oestradiolicum]|uniref:Trigger factor n=1 Tax=Denitratisoma oestradiolicum TaxID=311182 RepID=A0A6S6XUJ1_9PROT|nr:trigger factor [Denitratisoma oestradiolicum]TWO81283.1 trigger factor [Denitratisoma oestradiolicum]CAB1368465.1 Trigger factor [Denitratisoma oestradiolicum]